MKYGTFLYFNVATPLSETHSNILSEKFCFGWFLSNVTYWNIYILYYLMGSTNFVLLKGIKKQEVQNSTHSSCVYGLFFSDMAVTVTRQMAVSVI